MKVFGLILMAGLMSACGANIPMASDATFASVDANSTYTYKVSGQGITFAAGVYANFGAADQIESNTGNITIQDATPIEISTYGLNTVASIAYNGGAGTLTIEAYKNGSLVETKTIHASGLSANFNIDIE